MKESCELLQESQQRETLEKSQQLMAGKEEESPSETKCFFSKYQIIYFRLAVVFASCSTVSNQHNCFPLLLVILRSFFTERKINMRI